MVNGAKSPYLDGGSVPDDLGEFFFHQGEREGVGGAICHLDDEGVVLKGDCLHGDGLAIGQWIEQIGFHELACMNACINGGWDGADVISLRGHPALHDGIFLPFDDFDGEAIGRGGDDGEIGAPLVSTRRDARCAVQYGLLVLQVEEGLIGVGLVVFWGENV